MTTEDDDRSGLDRLIDEAAKKRKRKHKKAGNGTASGPGLLPQQSEVQLAHVFVAHHKDDLLHVREWGRWLRWDGTRWSRDTIRHAFNEARITCETAARDQEADRVKTAMTAAKTITAVENIASAHDAHARDPGQFDTNLQSFNCPGQTTDLVTMSTKPNSPEDLITMVTAVPIAPPGAPHPLWDKFLAKVLPEVEVRAYLQRFLGYCCTGSVREHALLFLWGTGRNGKSVLLSTVSGILGDYAVQAPMDAFLQTRHPRHETELAMLRGARLVTVHEVGHGRRWNEARIKAVTGGDKITARFMHRDHFIFDPQFKLIVSGNHRPSLASVDEAIKARFNLVHFGATIPESEQDKALPEKLKTEWPAILRWMVDGTAEWLRVGLDAPEAVRATTEEYLTGEDLIASWLADRTDVASSTWWVSTSDLFASFADWAAKSGEQPGSMKAFSQALKDRGFKWKRTEKGRGFFGIKIMPVHCPCPDCGESVPATEDRCPKCNKWLKTSRNFGGPRYAD